MPDNDQNLSQQEIQQLQQIAATLPTGHPAQKKVSLLLNSQPTKMEQDTASDPGFLGTLGNKAKSAWDSIAAGPGGNSDPTTADFWIGKPGERVPQFHTPPMIQQAIRPLPAGRDNPMYRAATTLSPLVPGLNPEAMESAADKGQTGAFYAETAIPVGMLAASVIAPRLPAIKNSIRGAARTALLDPVTGEPTVTPTSIAKRDLRTPDEVAQVQAEKVESQMNDYQTVRQKELADMEQLKEQDAQSRMLRGRQQAILDKPARDFDAGKPGPFNRVSSSPNIANEAFNPRSGSDIKTSPFPQPLRPLVGTPEEWNTYEQQMNILRPEASDAGTYHAARGASSKKLNLQERMGKKLSQ